jgi:hypothetical protein
MTTSELPYRAAGSAKPVIGRIVQIAIAGDGVRGIIALDENGLVWFAEQTLGCTAHSKHTARQRFGPWVQAVPPNGESTTWTCEEER